MNGRRLILLRHGQTSWNAAGRFQGQFDVPLDDLGHRQAAAAAAHLAKAAPSRLWSSDLTRARQTASYLADATGCAEEVDPRLRELDVGARQGLVGHEFEERFPEAFGQWIAGEDMPALPGAEVTEDVAARVGPALEEYVGALGEGETGIVVSHGATVKVALVCLLDWPLAQTRALSGVDNAAWVEVRQRGPVGPFRLEAYNRRVEP